MSAETDFRAALAAHAPLTMLVGQRIRLDAAEQSDAMPYVVFTSEHDLQHGMDGTLLGDICTMTVQCWAKTAVEAAAVADACAAAANAAQAPVTTRATGFDPELDADAVVLTISWLTG